MAHAETVLYLLKQRHGILLKPSFYNTWYQSQPSTAQTNPPERLYQSILTHFINTDIAETSQPSLQKNSIGQKTITLQLQDTLDTSHSLVSLIDALDKNVSISRGSLKWIMTDGTQDIVVFELGKNPSFNLRTPFGSKIEITSGHYVDGLLLVKPECIKLLGGKVPALYGDTMENELLRRYQRRLKEQGNTAAVSRSTQPPLSTFISTYQNRPPPPPPPLSTTTMPVRQTNNRIPSNTLDEDYDDEFDNLPMDDLTDFDELEQQALGSSFRSMPPNGTRLNGDKPVPKPCPALSLSTKPAKKTPHDQRMIIDLDDTPPSSPTVQNSHASILDFDDFMMDDTLIEEPSVPKPISVSDLRKLLQSVDDNSFTGDYDKVSVKIHGCKLRTMKPISNQGLYLVAELLEEYRHPQKLLVSFIYYGINSLFEGYSFTDLHQMKKQHGLAMVKEKVFKPLCARFNTIEAVLDIDLMLTENDESGLVRKGTNFTSLSPSG